MALGDTMVRYFAGMTLARPHKQRDCAAAKQKLGSSQTYRKQDSFPKKALAG
jgi:hypothetical protein